MGGIIMKRFSLEEYLKNPSKKVITRDSRNVRIICTDAKSDYPIIALVKEQYNDKEEIYTFTENGLGKFSPNKGLNDLFFAPEKKEGYVNILKIDNYCYLGSSTIFNSKEEAEEAKKSYLTYAITAKIEWEE